MACAVLSVCSPRLKCLLQVPEDLLQPSPGLLVKDADSWILPTSELVCQGTLMLGPGAWFEHHCGEGCLLDGGLLLSGAVGSLPLGWVWGCCRRSQKSCVPLRACLQPWVRVDNSGAACLVPVVRSSTFPSLILSSCCFEGRFIFSLFYLEQSLSH